MARMPDTIWKPIDTNYTRRKTDKRRVILHVADSESTSIHGWVNNPSSRASSHFYVARDGSIEQYVDTDHISWTSGEGNPDSIGIETQGRADGPWTAEQVDALVRIIAWAHETHGVPLRLMNSSKSTETGIGWHRLGVDGRWFPELPSMLAGRTQRGGGERWSRATGKSCPGDDRIPQIPGILEAAKAMLTPPPPPTPKPTPAPSTEDTGGTYTVKDGDTWWSISRKLGADMDALIAANGATPTTTLYTGQKLHTDKPRRYKITGAPSLNVRTGPGTQHPILGTAPKGTTITATGKTTGGWIEGSTPYMLTQGQTGWLSGAELTETK